MGGVGPVPRRSLAGIATAGIATAGGVGSMAAAQQRQQPTPPPLAHDIGPHAEPRLLVHRFHQPDLGSVNSWAIETAEAVIAIDGQRSLSAGRAVAQAIRALGKPVVAVLLTHPHPDHVGGLSEVAALRAPGAPLLGLARTTEILRTDAQGLMASSRRQAGDDFPAAPTLPDRAVADGEVLEVAGLRLRCREFRDVEAPTMLVTELVGGDAVFLADMVANGMTAFLLENHPQTWIAGLERLAADLPAGATGYPGHGAAGGARVLLAAQAGYLRRITELARRDPAAAAATMQLEYPGYLPVAAIPDLLERNIAALRR